MDSLRWRPASLMLLLALCACDQPSEAPQLWVYPGGLPDELAGGGMSELVDELMPVSAEPGGDQVVCGECLSPPCTTAWVAHRLPEGVTAIEPLHLRNDGVGDSAAMEVVHTDRLAVAVVSAPQGSQCRWTITATIANSELDCELVRGGPDQCDDDGPSSGEEPVRPDEGSSGG